MKTLQTLLAGILITPLLLACQQSSTDPLQNYQGLKGSTPTGEKPVVQTVSSSNPERYFSLNVIGPNSVNFVNMDQGKTAEVLLKVTINHPKIQDAELRLVNFPLADGPVLKKTNQPHVYSLSWHPEMGVVPRGDSSRDFLAQFQVMATEPRDSELTKIVNTFGIVIQVKGNSSQPSIKDQSKLEVIEEGVETKFIVTVEDPGSELDPVSKPELIISSYLSSNTEAYRANGAPYVTQENLEKISATQWRFTHSVFAYQLPLDRDRRGVVIPSASSVPVCFYVRAVGVTGRQSGQRLVCATGRYAAQPPTVTFEEGTPAQVKAGEEVVFKLKASTTVKFSQVDVPETSRKASSLSGTKTVECSPEDPSNPMTVNCTVRWKPLCVKAAQTQTLKMTATSTLNGKSKEASAVRVFEVLPNPEACKTTGSRS